MLENAQLPEQKRPRIERVNRGRGHSYKIDGQPVQGVTTLISQGLAKPALPYWSARCVAEYVADAEPEDLDVLRRLGRDQMVQTLKGIPWAARDAAAIQGTAVHKIAEHLITGQPVEYPDELHGHVESAVAFMDTWGVMPLLTEVVVASQRWSYCGTLDAIVDLPGGRRVLLDYKTGRSGVFPEVGLQLAAYRFSDLFVHPHTGEVMDTESLEIDAGYAVWLRADGFDVYPIACGREQFTMFLHVAHVGRAVEGMADWVGEPERPAVLS